MGVKKYKDTELTWIIKGQKFQTLEEAARHFHISKQGVHFWIKTRKDCCKMLNGEEIERDLKVIPPDKKRYHLISWRAGGKVFKTAKKAAEHLGISQARFLYWERKNINGCRRIIDTSNMQMGYVNDSV